VDDLDGQERPVVLFFSAFHDKHVVAWDSEAIVTALFWVHSKEGGGARGQNGGWTRKLLGGL